MGYTNYWYRKKSFTQEQWEKVCMKFFKIVILCDRKRITLAKEYDSPVEPQPSIWGGPKMWPTPPEVNNNTIQFNGWKDKGHETFLVTRELNDNARGTEGEVFDFCKTSRKPYDLAVMLTLLAMKEEAPRSIRISSDGDWDVEWMPAREAYKSLFGKEPKCPFKKEKA